MMMRPVQGLGGAQGMYPDQQYQNLQAEEHRHKQHEHRAEWEPWELRFLLL
jgi:hypothetical protein